MSRRGERKVAEWKFRVAGTDIVVPVTMVDGATGRYASRAEDRKTHFRVAYEPGSIVMTGTDIDAVQKDFDAKLRAWFKVDWTLFLLVETGPTGYSQGAEGGGLTFDYDWVAVGVRPDGSTIHTRVPKPDCGPAGWCERDVAEGRKPKGHVHGRIDDEKGTWNGVWAREGFAIFGGEHIQEGMPATGGADTGYDRGKMRVLLPATPENFATVAAFLRAVRTLQKTIRDRFSPGEVDRTMALIREGFLPALPAPTEAPDTAPTPTARPARGRKTKAPDGPVPPT